MDTAARHLEFAPPPTPGFLRALVLAILAHGVLLAILTVGVQWKPEAVQQRFEAELWSSIPVEAAPPAPPPPVPEEPKPVPPVVKPAPKPEPVPPPAEVQKQADIALQKEKAKLLKEKQLALEKQELEKKKLAELERQKQAKLEQEKKDKLDKQKKEQAEKLAREKEAQQRKLEAKETANLAKTREDQLKRMEWLAGATGYGGANSQGTAAQSAGPSASYAGKIVARIKPNITFPDRDNITGNPRTEVEIRTGPSGSILSARITQSSSIKSWDDAVLRAIDKTGILPRDVDGTTQPLLIIGFRPKD